MRANALTILAVSIAAAITTSQTFASAPQQSSNGTGGGGLHDHDTGLYEPDKYPVVHIAATPAGSRQMLSVAEPRHTASALAPMHWITHGQSLRKALNEWAVQADPANPWHVLWRNPDGTPSDADRSLPVPLQFDGAFKQAVEACIELFHSHGDRLHVAAWPDSKTIVITDAN